MELAVEQVALRVQEGGHNIPEDVIRRRYENGLRNFFTLYRPIVNNWTFVNNSGQQYQIIAKENTMKVDTFNSKIWKELNKKYYE